MGIQNNSFTRFYPNAGLVMGVCTMVGGTPALSKLSGNAIDDAQVSVVDTGTGLATISVTNFKGPQGFCLAQGNAIGPSGTIVSCSIGTYSANTATVAFGISTDAAVLADLDFQFQIWAF